MPDEDLRELRIKLENHLEESGEIRSDLKWLKKAFWISATAAISFNTTLVIGIIVYLLNHR